MIILPTSTVDPRYSFNIELDNVRFRFDFEWNDRPGHWLMSVADSSGTPLISGRRVVVGFPLLNRFRDTRLPAGMLEAIDTTDSDLDPGFADLGDRVKLVYTPVVELPPEIFLPV